MVTKHIHLDEMLCLCESIALIAVFVIAFVTYFRIVSIIYIYNVLK